MKKEQRHQKINHLIGGSIIGLFIGLFYIWIQRNYERYTSGVISAEIVTMIFTLTLILFWSAKGIKESVYRAAGMILIAALIGIWNFKQEFFSVFAFDIIILIFFCIFIKKLWRTKGKFFHLLLSMGVIALLISCNVYNLHGKSIQDYKSVYEMERIVSPKKEFEATSYMYDGDEKYIVFVEIREVSNGQTYNIYLSKQKNLSVKMKWISEQTMEINQKKINVMKDRYHG